MKRHVAFFTVLCLGLALNAPSLAQNKRAKAKRLFDKGIAALEDHDYKMALESFEEAYNTSPHWMVLAHIGTCRAKLNMPVEAIFALEKYLEDGGDDIPPDERQAARTLLEEQRKKVGVLHLIVTPDGAEAKVDGDSIGEAPFQRILLKSGPHHIIVIDRDKVFERDITIVSGQEHTLRIPDEPAYTPPVAVPAPRPQPEPAYVEQTPPPADETALEPDSSYVEQEPVEIEEGAEDEEMPNGVSVPFYIALGVTGAGVLTGTAGFIAFGYFKIAENDTAAVISGSEWDEYTWEDTCSSPMVDTDAEEYFCDRESERRDFEQKARYSFIPAIVGTSVAVAAGVTTVVFYFHPEWFSKNKSSVALTPAFGPNSQGLFLTGSF